MLRISEYATSKMRGLFRALSGLFRNRSSSHTSVPRRHRNGSPNHVVDGALQPVRFSTVLQQQAQSSPTPPSPPPVPDINTSTTTGRQWQPRQSSIYEPPQFLFFCGNENTARGSSFSLRLSRRGSVQVPAPAPPAPAPTAFTEVSQKPAASRMPVFFGAPPQQQHSQSSPQGAAEWTRPMNAPRGLILTTRAIVRPIRTPRMRASHAYQTPQPLSTGTLFTSNSLKPRRLPIGRKRQGTSVNRLDFDASLVASWDGQRMPLRAAPTPRNQPPLRCQTEHRRRKRLMQLFEREDAKGSIPGKNLPSLEAGALQLSLSPCKERSRLAPAAFLSPLKAARRPPQAVDQQPAAFHGLCESNSSVFAPANAASVATGTTMAIPMETAGPVTAAPKQQVTSTKKDQNRAALYQQIASEVALAQRWQEAEQIQANELALDVKNFQREQMQLKKQQRKDRKLEDRVLAEQMEWERAQVELMEGDRLQQMQAQRTRLRDVQYRAMQLDHRRANMAAMVQHFFDQLSALPAPRAIELFEEKREQLIQTCLQQVRLDNADSAAVENAHTELLAMVTKAQGDLAYRMRCHERSEFLDGERRNALLELQQSHRQQMQSHQQARKARAVDLKTARRDMEQDQHMLDERYRALEVNRKQKALTNSMMLMEQIRDHEAQHVRISLAVSGASPLYRTPYWSNESEERLQGFERPSTVQPASLSSPAHGKRGFQWYD